MKTRLTLVAMVLQSVIVLASFSPASAQYQKMDNSQFLSVTAGGPRYITGSWSKMLTNKTYLSLSETYFTTDERLFSTDNFLTEMAFVRSWVRIGDVYINGGLGGFFLYTTSETIAETTVDDFAGGLDLRAEIEYLPLWWLGLTGELRQLIIIASDFYDSQPLYGLGVRFYF